MNISPARRLTALALVVAPVLMGAALLVDITPQAEDTRELLQLISQQPGAWSAGQTLFFLSALAWLPGGLALVHLFRGQSRVGRIAAVAVIVGGMAVLPLDAAGLYLRELAGSDISLDQQTSLVEDVEALPTVIAFEVVHVVGLYLGLLVVGVAMLRHRGLPVWAGILVLMGLVGIAAAPGRAVLAVAAALLVAGLAMAAMRAARPEDAPVGGSGDQAPALQQGRQRGRVSS